MSAQHRLVIFDGVCNFCNGAVNFIIDRDPSGKFLFSPMQCEYAQNILRLYGVGDDEGDTLVLVKDNQAFVRSSAVLEIAKELSGYWCLLNALRVVPTPIRDWLYRIFGRNRYALFGRSATCAIPAENVRKRFVGVDF